MKKRENFIFNPFHLLLYFSFFPPTYTHIYTHTHQLEQQTVSRKYVYTHLCIYIYLKIFQISTAKDNKQKF